jgi:hypothetical protein
MSVGNGPKRGNTPPRQFRLDDLAMSELDAVAESLGVGTRTAAIRLLIRQEYVRQFGAKLKESRKSRPA